jgi:predicted RNA-binding protein with PUA-like domain
MQYWLVKSEPDTFSWDDLEKAKNKTTSWDGVRNYQARNFIKAMKKGDLVFFYHSVKKPTSIIGIVEVVKEAYVDHTQFDNTNKYYDEGSSLENPRWFMNDFKAKKRFSRPITLDELKNVSGLENMFLLKKGSRLSVQPVTSEEWNIIVNLI